MSQAARNPGPVTKSSYGLDSPKTMIHLSTVGMICLIMSICIPHFHIYLSDATIAIAIVWLGATAAGMIITVLLMIRSSYVGKIKLRDELVEQIQLTGDEHILDAGCGQGLFLISLTHRLTTGKAVGLDLWRRQDLTGNSPEKTFANAAKEGVSQYIDLVTADLRAMPFNDNTFDLVLSSLAVHNIPDPYGRSEAIMEMARIIKPKGQLYVIDFQYVHVYEQLLRNLGWHDIDVSPLNFSVFPPVRVMKASAPEDEFQNL